MFWRNGAPWVLVHGRNGAVFAVPWAATDLPTVAPALADDEDTAALLSPAALQALARFLRQHRASAPGLVGGGRDDRSVR